jgi:NAD(P)-dependent dehydrogenase (short-subunit alcohol dehydrogenase family)
MTTTDGGQPIVLLVELFVRPARVAEFHRLYLASDEASFVTGTELVIDGGMTAR